MEGEGVIMGADMAWTIEVNEYPESNGWTSKCVWHIDRDYRLFGLLSGIRGGSPVYEPRGFPDCRYDSEVYNSPNHYDVGASWLTLDELKIVRKAYGQHNSELNATIAAMEVFAEEYDNDVRLIFGCDQG